MAKNGSSLRHGLLAHSLISQGFLATGLLGVALVTAVPARAQNDAPGGTMTPASDAQPSPTAAQLTPDQGMSQGVSQGVPSGAAQPGATAQPAAPPAPPPGPVVRGPIQMQHIPPGRVTVTSQRPTVDAVSHPLGLEAGAGVVVSLPGQAANIFVADPKVAEVRPASATSLFVFGVAPGRTTVAALDPSGKVLTQYSLTVRPSAFGAGEAAANINRVLHNSNVHVTTTVSGLSLTGTVTTPAEANEAATVAQGYLTDKQTLDNHIIVTTSAIVGLHVKIAEMNRQLSRQLGVSWQALGQLGQIGAFPAVYGTLNGATAVACALGATHCSGASFNGTIEALAQDGLVRTLAEPNLTARSGEAANFLVGGEYPIPISQAYGTTTIDYKQYGISLSFVPTVLSSGRISLHVRPEVSQLSSSGAVTTSGGISVPALTVRRAETTIEMGSGDSFAIAGLLQDSVTQTDSGLPGLGDIPIIGALFRSDSFQHNQTELVIIVTPYLVDAVTDPNALKLPTDGFKPPNDIERMLLLRQQALPTTQASLPSSVAHVPGSAGFVLQ